MRRTLYWLSQHSGVWLYVHPVYDCMYILTVNHLFLLNILMIYTDLFLDSIYHVMFCYILHYVLLILFVNFCNSVKVLFELNWIELLMRSRQTSNRSLLFLIIFKSSSLTMSFMPTSVPPTTWLLSSHTALPMLNDTQSSRLLHSAPHSTNDNPCLVLITWFWRRHLWWIRLKREVFCRTVSACDGIVGNAWWIVVKSVENNQNNYIWCNVW